MNLSKEKHQELPDEEILDYHGDLYEIECPHCAETIVLLEECLDQGELSCPVCKEILEIDFSGEIEPDLLGEIIQMP